MFSKYGSLFFMLLISVSVQGQSLITFIGGSTSNDNYHIDWSAGEIGVGTLKGNENIVTQGYQQPISQKEIVPQVTEQLEVFNMVTPTADKNSQLIVEGGEPPFDLLIYNRWGEIIQEFKSYSNESSDFWKNLPTNTYYYAITKDDKLIKKGVFYILQ